MRCKGWLAAGVLLLAVAVAARSAAVTEIPIHDPSLIRVDGKYYLFGTGRGIVVWTSADRVHWQRQPPVFSAPPAWAEAVAPGFKGDFWAPDINRVNGRYYLYYAVSAFGKNTSAIGLVTNETLDSQSPQYHWTDRGKVVESVPGRTDWNAIDPNLAFDRDGTPWIAFGSFWSGLKLVRLTPELDRTAGAECLPLASRVMPGSGDPAAPAGEPVQAGGNAIEAPFIFRRDPYFYLFASIDYCCRGPKSTYKIIVGRAPRISGPFVDRAGAPLLGGGGTVLQGRSAHWYGAGHNCVVSLDGTDYVVAHGYDTTDRGKSKLLIEPIRWTADGWPELTPEP